MEKNVVDFAFEKYERVGQTIETVRYSILNVLAIPSLTHTQRFIRLPVVKVSFPPTSVTKFLDFYSFFLFILESFTSLKVLKEG